MSDNIIEEVRRFVNSKPIDKNYAECYSYLMGEKETNEPFKEVVSRVIECYKKVLNSGMALDACRVQGKLRAMILADPEYIRETKAIRAEKYFQELDEVEEIRRKANSLDIDDGGRGGGQSVKDAVTLQLKAAQMRRDLLQLSSDNSDDESDALNFFFCPVSREEMERMKRVEVFYGSGDDDAVLASLIEETGETPEEEPEERAPVTTEEVISSGEDEVEFL